MNILPISKGLAIAIVAALTVTACSSEPTTPNDVSIRQDIMQDWRISSDIMKSMLFEDRFDAKAFKEQADAIQASTHVWAHFDNDAEKGKAQDTVWTDAAGFKLKAQMFDDAVGELVSAADKAQSFADVEKAFGKMNESCGSCHKSYKSR